MQEKTPQHYRVTLDQAKRDYQDGLLTATGLVYYAIAILRPPGQKLRIKQSFIENLGLGKRTFYRALSKLRTQNQVEWEPTEMLNVWTTLNRGVVSISDVEVQESTTATTNESLVRLCHIDPLEGQICHNLGQIDPLEGQICHNLGQIDPLEGQICHNLGQICHNQGSKPRSDKGSSDSPDITDIYQIFINSLSNSERENFEIFSREAVSKLPSKPVLPETWIKKNHLELWRQYKGTDDVKQESKSVAIAITLPSIDQMIKLQEFKDAGKIKDFHPNSFGNNGTIIVDTGSEVLMWYEFFETVDLEP